uniref:Uncharacterized protein n=1 Tax=Arundo donax TaxID=35708 RepID=A0A0A9HPA2_ARUDO
MYAFLYSGHLPDMSDRSIMTFSFSGCRK